MPIYLKKDTIRLLEASVESISLAIMGLGMPNRIELREQLAKNAIQIGLVGVAAELAMSAIIVQGAGVNSLQFETGFYKTGSHILDDFRKLIKTKLPKMAFLTQGVKNPSEHMDELIKHTAKFRLLIKSRAGGLHAGIGPSRDVCIICTNEVISFLNTLRMSSRIKPYICNVPGKFEIVKSHTLIIDELAQRIKDSGSLTETAQVLASIYLVLPEIPDEEPDWISAFEKITMAPKEEDISFLLDTLGKSKSASLIKVSKSEIGLPVVVRPNNPNAIPIEPQFLKKSFTSIRDRWYADIGNANGRLEESTYNTPPIESVFELFAFKLEKLNITKVKEDLLNANETWPFICASLSYSGTIGPYWYFVRKTKDIRQLESFINRAIKIGDGCLKKNHGEFKIGIEAIRKKSPLSNNSKFVLDLMSSSELSDTKRKDIVKIAKKNYGKTKALNEEGYKELQLVLDEEMSIGQVLIKLVENGYGLSDNSHKSYWARTLCEAASDEEDLDGLLAVLKSQELQNSHTAARKAMRVIDFLNYGPQVEIK